MKARTAVLFLVMAAGGLAAEGGVTGTGTETKPGATSTSSASPTGSAAVESTPGPGEKVVILSPLKVIDSRDKLLKAMIEKEKSTPSEKFTLKDGGYVMRKQGKKVTAEMGVLKPEPSGITLFRFSW